MADQTTDTEQPTRKPRWGRRIVYGVLAIAILSVATLFIAPKYVVRTLIADDLDRLGITHEGVETLKIDLWNQEASIGPFKFKRGKTSPGGVARIGAKIDIKSLLSRDIVLSNVFIDGVDLNIVRSKNGNITINGVTPSEFAAPADPKIETEDVPEKWHARLEAFELRNSKVLLRQEGAGDLEFVADKITLSEFDTAETESFGAFSIQGRINGIGFSGKGSARLFSPAIAVKLDSKVNGAALAKVERFTGPLKFIKGAGTLDAETKHDLVLEKNGGIRYSGNGKLMVKDADMTLAGAERARLGSAALSYSGGVVLSPDQRVTKASLESTTEIASLNFTTGESDPLQIKTDEAKLTNKLEIKQGKAGETKVSGTAAVTTNALAASTASGFSGNITTGSYSIGGLDVTISEAAVAGATTDEKLSASNIKLGLGADDTVSFTKLEASVGSDSFSLETFNPKKLEISISDATAQDKQGSIGFATLKAQVDSLSHGGDGGQVTRLKTGKINVAGVIFSAAWPEKTEGAVGTLGSGSITIDEFNLTGDGKADFKGSFSADGIAGSVDKDKIAKIALDKIGVEKISIDSPDRISTGSVTIGTLAADISSALLDALSSDPKKKDADTGSTLNINGLSIAAPANLRYRDQSVTPATTTDLLVERLRISNIAPDDPKAISTIDIKSKINGFTGLDLTGQGTFFSEFPEGEAKGGIDKLQISRFSSYSKSLLGLNVNSGELTAGIDGKVNKGKIDGGLDIRVERLKFGKISAAEAKQFKDQIGVPVETAASLLKDSKNNIKLKIPVTGTLEKPEFDLSGAISKAVGSLLKTVFPPTMLLGIVRSVGSSDSGTIAVVPFDAGASALDNTGKVSIDKLLDLMQQRPELSLRVCGVSNLADRAVLIQTPAKAATPAAAEKLLVNKLSALALARTVAVRKALSARGKGIGKRVAECRAQWLPKDKLIPRAEVKF